jgi:acyl-coenzyme A thioesterase PaaI-like protein
MSELLIDAFIETDSEKFTTGADYEKRLLEISTIYHSRCIFKHNPPMEDLRFYFSDDGILCGKFMPTHAHQGYDSMVHGGIIAAIIDASMAQCLMGHGIVAFTAELSVRYKQPVFIHEPVELRTKIVEDFKSKMFRLECCIVQNGNDKVNATAKFMTISQ